MAKAKAYVMKGCPFSFKFLVFMAEAGLLDQIEIVQVKPDDQSVKDELARATGSKPSFPTVETAPGTYLADSDALIDHYAKAHGIDQGNLSVLPFYKEGLFQDFIRLYKENQQLKAAQG